MRTDTLLTSDALTRAGVGDGDACLVWVKCQASAPVQSPRWEQEFRQHPNNCLFGGVGGARREGGIDRERGRGIGRKGEGEKERERGKKDTCIDRGT